MMLPKSKGKSRKTKINLVFNEDNRRDFLTGFHKRKLQRKKKAKEQLDKDLKEEKKRLKAEAKESYKKLVKSHAPIPEVEELLAEEYEDDDVNVKVVELSTSDIAKENNWIGSNQPTYESEEEAESESEGESEDEIPGMEVKVKKAKSSKVEEGEEEKSEGVKSKNVKKMLRRQATKNVQKSKAYQLKNKIEMQKQKKKSLHQKKIRMKLQDKAAKKRGGRGKK